MEIQRKSPNTENGREKKNNNKQLTILTKNFQTNFQTKKFSSVEEETNCEHSS